MKEKLNKGDIKEDIHKQIHKLLQVRKGFAKSFSSLSEGKGKNK